MSVSKRSSALLALFLSFCVLALFSSPADAAFALPARVTFTFDDVNDRMYDNARPLFEAHGMPAVIYAETLLLNSGEEWVMTWAQVNDLEDRLGWEIGSHSISHPDLTTVTNAQLRNELTQSKQSFTANGVAVNSFATPYGRYDDRVLKAIAKFYSSHRAAWGGQNMYPEIFNDYEILALEVTHLTSPETVMLWIDEAIANNQWLVLLLHDVVDGIPIEYEYNKNDLKTIVDYAASRPIEPVTITQGLAISNSENIMSNGSFESVVNEFAQNWTRTHTTGVTVNTNNNGNAPSYKNSLRIVAGAEQREAVSDLIPIENRSYLFEMFANTSKYTSGGLNVFVSEYDSAGSYVSGQWIGGRFTKFFGVCYFEYTPTSSAVTSVKLHIYTTAGSSLTVFVDSVALRAMGGPVAPPPPPPPPPPSPPPSPSGDNLIQNGSFETAGTDGFAAEWTRNQPLQVIVDSSGNGYTPSPQNSLKIVGSATQNTAFSAVVTLDPLVTDYVISYYARSVDYVQGGTALWVNEFDASGNWLGGQWLGGFYRHVDEILSFNYTPSSSAVSLVDVHIFSEEGSSMTLYVDEVAMRKR